ncbi:MAG: hypothetical protein IKM88_06230 [Lachnospiraceae bacterium]|nr:hypothetical protein [Lachnospiraceae bacterium]MBR6849815.1 hypothetical protein [Lachnospiraceae bacterium]
MSDRIIEQYLASSEELDRKTKDFDKTVKELRKSLYDKIVAFDKSIEIVRKSKIEYGDKIIEQGQEILNQIEDIWANFASNRSYSYCGSNSDLIEEAFGIVISKAPSGYQLSISCELYILEKITDDYIVFYADEDLREGDWASGDVSIPRKYFETDCLSDEAFIAEKCEQLEKLKTRKWIKSEQKEIDELEKRLAEKKKHLAETIAKNE